MPASRKAFAAGWWTWFGVTIATTSMPSSRAASFAAIPSIAISFPPSAEAEHAAVGRLVGSAGGEVLERRLGDPDDVVGDERRPFGCAVLGMLQAAFPLEHRPAAVVVAGELRENAGKVDLAVAERTEPASSVQPGLEARIHALMRARIELGVLDVKRLDPLMVDVDEAEVIELLQQKVAWIVVDAAARMVADPLEKHLEGRAVHQVLARMDLVADVDAMLVEHVQDRLPASCELVEGGF